MTGVESAIGRLEAAALVPLVEELARRFEGGSPVSRVTVTNLDERQREGLADLLGRDRLPGPTVRLAVADHLATLDLSDVGELRSAVGAITGPLGDRRADRVERQRRRSDLWKWCAEQLAGVPLLADAGAASRWADALRQTGVRGGDDGEVAFRRRLGQAVTVLRGLPTREAIGLAPFADDLLADPHALDRGSAVEGLVIDALAVALARPRPRDSEAVRQLWERVGVVPDPLSSTVTVLGLRPTGGDHLASWMRSCAEASEAAVVTLAQLRRWPVAPLRPSETVCVVENPSVVAHAASRGWAGPPVICSSGRPTVAVVTLIRQLGAGGSVCRQHADFDPAGLDITAWLAERAGTVPWLMTAGAYRTALEVDRPRVRLPSSVPRTSWDPALGPTMTAAGVVVYEEELRFDLLGAMVT